MIDITSLPVEQVTDPRWRLTNLYSIRDETGAIVPFRLRPMQQAFFDNFWYFNLILKSRQLGASTMIDLMLLDVALFMPNQSCAIVADTLPKAQELFEEKIVIPYRELPQGFRRARFTETENTQEIAFDNGSKITVGTSVRGLTFQWLHISELGPICKAEPLKAHEIKTGAFNTVHAGQHMIVESTSVGAEGLFYEMCQQARAAQLEGRKLTRLGWKFHFYGWFLDPRYRLLDHEIGLITISEADHLYFDGLEQSLGIKIDEAQRGWYVAKREDQGEDMFFEYPSTPDEAFYVSTEGRIFGKQMQRVRAEGRIRHVPCVPHVPVNTFWDLGHSDKTAIWFHQYFMGEHRFIRYYQFSGEDLSHYVAYCRNQGYIFGAWVLPHDARSKRVNEKLSAEGRLIEMGIPKKDIFVVDRVTDKWTGSINVAKSMLPVSWFDAENCKDGIWCLDHYTKAWNKSQGCWRDEPAENHDANHGSDAFQEFAKGWKLVTQTKSSSAPRLPNPVLDVEIGY